MERCGQVASAMKRKTRIARRGPPRAWQRATAARVPPCRVAPGCVCSVRTRKSRLRGPISGQGQFPEPLITLFGRRGLHVGKVGPEAVHRMATLRRRQGDAREFGRKCHPFLKNGRIYLTHSVLSSPSGDRGEDTDAIPVSQEFASLVKLRFDVVHARFGPKLDGLRLGRLLRLCPFRHLVAKFSVVHDLADRWPGVWRHFYQVETKITCDRPSLLRTHDAELFPLGADHSNGVNAYIVINPVPRLGRAFSTVDSRDSPPILQSSHDETIAFVLASVL